VTLDGSCHEKLVLIQCPLPVKLLSSENCKSNSRNQRKKKRCEGAGCEKGARGSTGLCITRCSSLGPPVGPGMWSGGRSPISMGAEKLAVWVIEDSVTPFREPNFRPGPCLDSQLACVVSRPPPYWECKALRDRDPAGAWLSGIGCSFRAGFSQFFGCRAPRQAACDFLLRKYSLL
jgi:hypothetical protein